MKKLLFILIFICMPTIASAQCNGVFQPGTACGNISGTPKPPSQVPIGSIISPAGVNGDIQYNNNGVFGGATLSALMDTAYCNTIGYIIVRTIGSWTCSRSIPLNVVWFGADPTGVADSLAAYNTVSAAILVQGGGTMYVPPGTFLFKVSGSFASFTQPIVNVNSNMSVVCDQGALLYSQAIFGGFNSALFTPTPMASNFSIDGCRFRAAPPIQVVGNTTIANNTITLTSGTTANFYKYMPIAAAGMAATVNGKYYVDTVINSTQFTVARAGSPTNPTAIAIGVVMAIQYSGSTFIGSQPGNKTWSATNIKAEDVNSAFPTGYAFRFIVMGQNVTLRNIGCSYAIRVSSNPFDFGGEDCIHAVSPLSNFIFDNVHCNPSGDDCVAVLIENNLQPGYDSDIYNGLVSNVYGASVWGHMLDEIVAAGTTIGTINNITHTNIRGVSGALGSNPGIRGININDLSARNAIHNNSYIDFNIDCTSTALDCYGINSASNLLFSGIFASNPKLEAFKMTSCNFCTLLNANFGANQTAATDSIVIIGGQGNQVLHSNITASKRVAIRFTNTTHGTILGNYFLNNPSAVVMDGAGAIFNNIASNNFNGNTVNFSQVNSATNNQTPPGNVGLDPRAVIGVAPGASPWTYTSGSAWETVYIQGGTVSQILDTATTRQLFVNTNVTVRLAPYSSMTVVYSAAPNVAVTYN